MDIRHNPTEDDKMMINYLYHYRIPFTVIATKADKLSKTKIKPALNVIATDLRVGIADINAVDYKGFGKDKVLSEIEKAIKIKEEHLEED